MRLIFVAILIASSSASRVLFLFPTPSKSHLVIAHAVSTALAESGHEVTVVSPFPLEYEVINHRYIKSPIPKETQIFMDKLVEDNQSSIISMLFSMPQYFILMAKEMIKMQNFQNLLNEKFDLIVIGMAFNNFLLGYGDHFKCPTVVLSVQQHMVLTNAFVGNPTEPHAVATMGFVTDNWSFASRVKNFLATIGFWFIEVYGNHIQKQTYK